MSEPSEHDLLLTGRIIAATREIESRMVECGASGNGLREKTESLAGKLPPEAVKLSIFIGNVRNRLAHETDSRVSDDEAALFDEAVRMLLHELDRLAGNSRVDSGPDAAAVVVPPPQSPVPETILPERLPAAERSEAPEADSPVESESPPALGFAAWIPVLHLAFAGELLLRSIRLGWEYAALLIGECAMLALLSYAVYFKIEWMMGVAGSLLVAIYLYGVFDAFRRRADYPGTVKLGLIPLVNLVYFMIRLIAAFQIVPFLGGVTILSCWGTAIYFGCMHEWLAMLIFAGISWGTALIAWLSCRHR